LKIHELGVAQRAKTGRVFLVLDVSFKTLSIHAPGSNYHPWNTKAVDCSYQFCTRSVPVRGNAEIEAFTEAHIMSSVMKLVFEVDQIDVHLHDCLQTKAGLLGNEQPCFCY
jgi:hypothetical protein